MDATSHGRRLKVALLSSDEPHGEYLACLLARRFDLVLHVVEPGAHKRRQLLEQRRYVDWAAGAYHAARRRVAGHDRYRREYFGEWLASLPETARRAASRVPRLVVRTINDPEVAARLSSVAPDAVVVLNTSILRGPVLAAAGAVVLNVHGGYLPDFRGRNTFFFTLLTRAFDRVGSTIHFVTPTLDAGDIVEVAMAPVYPSDDEETLYCRSDRLAFDRLCHWLGHLESGGALPRFPQPARGRVYRMRDRTPLLDARFWWLRRSGRIALPRIEAPIWLEGRPTEPAQARQLEAAS